MTELEMPEDVGPDRAVALISEVATTGDEVRITQGATTLESDDHLEGTIVSIDGEHLVLDTGEESTRRLVTTEIDSLALISEH